MAQSSPGKWCHCSSPAQQVTLRPQRQMDDALGKHGEKSAGHGIVGSGIRKGEVLSTALKRCISAAVICADGLWCRLLPCKADLGKHSQPRRPWFLRVLHVIREHRPLSPLERHKSHPSNTHSSYLCQNCSSSLGGFFGLGEVWKKEDLRFSFPCPEWPLNESACERDSRQMLLAKGWLLGHSVKSWK